MDDRVFEQNILNMKFQRQIKPEIEDLKESLGGICYLPTGFEEEVDLYRW